MRRTCEWEKEGSFDCLASQLAAWHFKGAVISGIAASRSHGVRVTSSHLSARVTRCHHRDLRQQTTPLHRLPQLSQKPRAGLLDFGQEQIDKWSRLGVD